MVNLVGRDELLLQIVSHFLLGGDELSRDVSAAPPGAVWSESSKRENILSKLSSPDKYNNQPQTAFVHRSFLTEWTKY